MDDIPRDFPVVPVATPINPYRAYAVATCGECGLSWDDTVSTQYTPAPGGRCPFEAFHQMDEDEPVDDPITADDRAIILEALGTWRAFGRYGDGRSEFQARVQDVIDKLENGAVL